MWWILAFIFFGKKATVGTTLELTDVIKNTVCYRQWGLKREIKGSFSAGLLRRGFDGKTKEEFSPSLHFTFSLLSFALCSSFSRQSQSSLAMAQSALPSPDAWALGSHAGCDFFFDRLPNRDRDSQRQAKAPFHTQLDRAKKPSFVLDFPGKKCNHVLPPLAFKRLFPDTLSQNTFYTHAGAANRR